MMFGFETFGENNSPMRTFLTLALSKRLFRFALTIGVSFIMLLKVLFNEELSFFVLILNATDLFNVLSLIMEAGSFETFKDNTEIRELTSENAIRFAGLGCTILLISSITI